MKNLYYILTVTPTELPILVGQMTDKEKAMFPQEIDTVRWNLSKTKCVVSLKLGIKTPPKQIAHLTPFTHKSILVEMNKKEWNNDLLD